MNRATGKRFGPHRLIALTAIMTALAACEEGFNLADGKVIEEAPETDEATETLELFPSNGSGTQNDVEAPEVFQVTEAGLWDGRPSLGGIWVAHPDVTQPERVLIKNTSNNKSITGALFRRDGNLPGPALQVSSLAAQELGMLAGSPTRIEVVALRREEIAPPPEEKTPEDAPETTDTDTEVASVDAEATTADTSDTEEKPAKRKWWQKKPAEEAGTVAAGAAAGAAVAASAADDTASVAADAVDEVATEDKPAKRKWWQKKTDDVAEAPAAEAAAAATVTETADETAATASLSDPEITPPEEKPAKRKWWQKKDPDEITETPLDPIEGAAAAIEAAEPTPVTTTAAAGTAATPALSKPYVQVGTFSVQANANSAAQKIRRNGMAADVRELQSEDKTIWRVLVGPATTRAERKAILSDVKDLGFTDAFTTGN